MCWAAYWAFFHKLIRSHCLNLIVPKNDRKRFLWIAQRQCDHGDQIGRIFAGWVIRLFGQVFWKFQTQPIFWGNFFHGKSYVFILTKMGWTTFWAIYILSFVKLIWSPWMRLNGTAQSRIRLVPFLIWQIGRQINNSMLQSLKRYLPTYVVDTWTRAKLFFISTSTKLKALWLYPIWLEAWSRLFSTWGRPYGWTLSP
jgi:hypothetical protein